MSLLAQAAAISQALSVLAAPASPGLDFATVVREERQVSPGVSVISVRVPETPCEVRMAKFDLAANPKLKLRFVLGTEGKATRLTPEELAKKAARESGGKPVAALNGDFFLYEKGAKDGKPAEPARPFGITLVDGKLAEIGCWGPTGYEIVGRRADGTLGFGKLTSKTGEDGSFRAFMDGAEVVDAIRVWNRPLQNGRVVGSKEHVCYPDDEQKNYPRSLVGLGTNLVVFLVADARQYGWSLGMPSYHAAEILRREGCTDAGQFDGGGSTALWVEGKYLNRPSDGKPRAVANGLAITR